MPEAVADVVAPPPEGQRSRVILLKDGPSVTARRLLEITLFFRPQVDYPYHDLILNELCAGASSDQERQFYDELCFTTFRGAPAQPVVLVRDPQLAVIPPLVRFLLATRRHSQEAVFFMDFHSARAARTFKRLLDAPPGGRKLFQTEEIQPRLLRVHLP